ncbi:MAG: hypothetical protein M3Z22_03245, partial [Verrucomicrobiota bacterium]|nr:hypothetical protein [Verrucomicrobiota bacterium]
MKTKLTSNPKSPRALAALEMFGAKCLALTLLVATIFSSSANGQATFTTIYRFPGDVEGAYPSGGLVEGADGNFYGATQSGGSGGGDSGIIYRVTPAGVKTTIHNFVQPGEGVIPQGEPVFGSDGRLYGVTKKGGTHDAGTVFKVTAAGVLTTLFNFDPYATTGDYPATGLSEGRDGNFYGTTNLGDGTVCQVTPAGHVTTLHQFTNATYANGQTLHGGVVQGADGNIYGTTVDGGTGHGTVFRVSPTGAFTVLYRFSGQGDGGEPEGNLIEGADGNFYGTTLGGQTLGTVFKITPAGVLTTLYTFTGDGAADGAYPDNGVIQGSDGNFYGTTSGGGFSTGLGTIFQLTPHGVLKTLYHFTGGNDASGPNRLVQAADGSFYGTTRNPDRNQTFFGSVFHLTVDGVGPQPTPTPPPHGGLSPTVFTVNESDTVTTPAVVDSILRFRAVQTGTPADLIVRVQSSQTPAIESSWTYLPDGLSGRMVYAPQVTGY